MNSSIGRRVAALESGDTGNRVGEIVTAPSGNVLIIDKRPGEDMGAFRRRVRDAWLAGGNPPELLPIEYQTEDRIATPGPPVAAGTSTAN